MRFLFYALLVYLFSPNSLWAQPEAIPKEAFTVRLQVAAMPDHLVPYISKTQTAGFLQSMLYQPLLELDPKSLELRPVLAESRPRIQEIKRGPYAGGIALHYTIHSKATWDNGKPITAEDYLFTIKYIKFPFGHTAAERPYYEFIDSVEIHRDPQKFTVYFKEPYFLAEHISGSYVLPKYIYDPNNISNEVSIAQLNDPAQRTTILKNSRLRIMAGQAAARIVDPEQVVGSGPYSLSAWEPDKLLRFKRKEDWWGHRTTRSYIQAIPDYLEYQIIKDKQAAVAAFRLGKLDLVSGIPAADFRALQNLYEMRNKAQFFNPNQFTYHYIGFNMQHPILKELPVRQAFRHLIDRDVIINDMMLKMARPTDGPISPYKPYYAKNLPACNLDLLEAQRLLLDAGWEDLNNDEILDKEIDGEIRPFHLTFLYNQGNELRREIGKQLQVNAKKVGIEVVLKELEFAPLLDSLSAKKFDIVCLAWSQDPTPDDLKANWHSESIDASNYISFSDKQVDKLIEQIRITPSEQERREKYVELQRLITAQCPYVFLFTPMERLLVSKELEVPFISSMSPGVDPKRLKKKEE